jgi:2'-5' RNA ligase
VKVGTISGRPQSALLIPVPAAEALVARARLDHDPVAAAGVPAHITLIAPWLEPSELDADDGALPELTGALADCKAFDFELASVRWFGDRVLWLAPTPIHPFVALTERLAERFCTPPWAGKFPDLVPHLTVGHAGAGGPLQPVAEALAPALPLSCRAEEVWAMVGDGRRWHVYARVALS